jgi:Ser/Thr protein kinase RdoA (MazF antagonist)
VLDQALDGVARCFERAGTVPLLRLHGDCHAGNVLWTGDGPHFVDFDDSRMGPAVQDLWMLLSGERQEMVGQLGDVLAGYEDFCEFDPRQLYLVEALRTLRLIHYSAWLAMRWDDPAFPGGLPLVQYPALLAGPHPGTARAGRIDGRAAPVAGVITAHP